MKSAPLLIMMVLLSSCGTLFSDSHDVVTFKSEPPGATVYLNGEKIGQTPVEHKIERKTFEHPKVIIKKKGYETVQYDVQKTLNTAAIFNLSSISSWATDAISGKAIRYSPTSYYTELKRKGRAEAQPINSVSKFVIVNSKNLQQDLVRGKGEYLESYAQLKDLSSGEVLLSVNSELEQLASLDDAVEFYQALEAAVAEEVIDLDEPISRN